MLFNSLTFLVFFCVVYALFWLLRRWGARKNLLLAASYVFYGAWSPPYVLLLAASTSADWFLARMIWRTSSPSRRKALLVLSLVCNLGLLAYFKYGGFLLDNFEAMAAAAGFHAAFASPDIVLPIGISFYTFASLSYTIDVYRGHVNGDWSFRDYALFVSFFPHLVAGPIVRAEKLLPQIRQPRTPTSDQIAWGFVLVVFGLFCKVVLADSLLAPIVDKVYRNPSAAGALDAWAAVLGFSGQIYYDFSGYSSCAIGLALCFGFAFPDNFRYPYGACGVADFWRRWHISLSTWLRDYLYIPLGGNRHGSWATTRNLMITMLLGGLWHGASWMFVLWGGLHGIYLAVENRWRSRADAKASVAANPRNIGSAAMTFVLVTLTWIPFRAGDIAIAGGVVRALGRFGEDSILYAPQIAVAVAVMLATFSLHFMQSDSSLEEAFARFKNPLRTAAIAACLVGLYLVSGGSGRAFIYYQF